MVSFFALRATITKWKSNLPFRNYRNFTSVCCPFIVAWWQGRPEIFFQGGHRRRKGSVVGGHHGECGARAYNGGLGAEPPAGSRGRAPGQGVRGEAPWSWKHLGHWMSNGAGKFSPFPKMHLYFYSRCNGNDMGKIYVEIQGGHVTPLPLPGGAHAWWLVNSFTLWIKWNKLHNFLLLTKSVSVAKVSALALA